MKPETILQADLLDIVFENRNKDYGAYTLRRDYNGRMIIALSGMLAIALVFVLMNVWKGNKAVEQIVRSVVIPPDVNVKQVEIVKPPVEPPARKPVATIKDMTPRIVPDNVPVDPPPTVDELDNDDKAIGAVNQEGEKPTTLPPAKESTGTAPSAAPEATAPEILVRAEIMPEFPGGEVALHRFLQRNLKFDFGDMEPGSRLEIRCRFIVDVNGNVTGIGISKSAGKDIYDNEVTRVVGKMPTWNPGKQNGRNVNVYFTLPVVVVVPE